MIIGNTSLEVLRECTYSRCDLGMLSNYAYLSIVVTNDCRRKCFYCINSETDRTLELPIEKALENIKKAVEKYKIKEAILLGGEPTLHPRLFELLDGLHRIEQLKNIGITTNGIKLGDHEFVDNLCNRVSWINVSIDNEKQLADIVPYLTYIRNKSGRPKVRINTNVYRDNHDTLDSLLEFIKVCSVVCDEMRVSNLIQKDSFSVNPVQNKTSRILEDSEYEELFEKLIRYYRDLYTIIYNPQALGFVKYYLIPSKTPITLNWNIGSTVSKQVCENTEKEINTFKCLVSGDISLSWNKNNIIDL